MIRKATKEDVKKVIAIYDEIITLEENGPVVTGWKRGMYPTPRTAEEGFERGEMFVIESSGEVAGSMILNKRQDEHYSLADWPCDAEDDEVMVLHSFVVSPSHSRKGLGEKLFEYYEQYAIKNGCRCIRFSTNHTNFRSRNFYRKMGVAEVCELEREIRGVKGYSVLFEKELGNEDQKG